jgi:hypothetical protein
MHPILVSEVRDLKITKEISTLSEVKEDGNVYRVRISVSHTSSTNPSKCLKIKEKDELKPYQNCALKKG